MVSRAAKHVFSRYLRKLPLLHVPGCVGHLLNCLIGFKVNSSPTPDIPDDDALSAPPAVEWTKLDVTSMRDLITKEIFKRYRFALSDEWWHECKCITLLREVCLKMGFQLKARDYAFEKTEPIVNGNGKHK